MEKQKKKRKEVEGLVWLEKSRGAPHTLEVLLLLSVITVLSFSSSTRFTLMRFDLKGRKTCIQISLKELLSQSMRNY